jgi:hypothetical protein
MGGSTHGPRPVSACRACPRRVVSIDGTLCTGAWAITPDPGKGRITVIIGSVAIFVVLICLFYSAIIYIGRVKPYYSYHHTSNDSGYAINAVPSVLWSLLDAFLQGSHPT